jgi:hypothetical protein
LGCSNLGILYSSLYIPIISKEIIDGIKYIVIIITGKFPIAGNIIVKTREATNPIIENIV